MSQKSYDRMTRAELIVVIKRFRDRWRWRTKALSVATRQR